MSFFRKSIQLTSGVVTLIENRKNEKINVLEYLKKLKFRSTRLSGSAKIMSLIKECFFQRKLGIFNFAVVKDKYLSFPSY